MQIKAQGLLNAAKWIEAEYGRDALGEVVRACSPEVRDRYVSGIAINWHPVEEFIEFVDTADRMLGRGNGQLAEAIGAAGARANMKGTLVRVAFYLAQPEFFFRRVAGLWSQFNDEGQMVVHSLVDNAGSMEVAGLKSPNATFCAVLTGWTRQVATGLGIHNPKVRHVECRARGEARCIWDVRWNRLEEDDKTKRAESASQMRAAPGRFPSSGSLPATRPASAPRVASTEPPPEASRKLPPPKGGSR